MNNIYMRAGMSPIENISPYEMLTKNIIGSNIGNLLYQYSVSRTLSTKKNLDIMPNRYVHTLTDEEIDEINSKNSCFIIPLADAFRSNFGPELRGLTQTIKKLKIPCVVIGVGLRAQYEPNLNQSFPFDNDVKEFVKAVLDKSSVLGLRGEITSDYLTRLGFKEGRDHTVIGCPSLYTFGRELKIRDAHITTDSKVFFNSSASTPNETNQFIMQNANRFKDSSFIPQEDKELSLIYSGRHFYTRPGVDFTNSIGDKYYHDNQVKFFLNAFSWFDAIKNVDLSFGSRLHGNVAAIINGTPSFIITKDSRTRELAKYHNMTSVNYKDINADDNIFDLIEKLDFHAPEKVQAQNFDHYIDFLNANNLDHIYSKNLNNKKAPYDSLTKKANRNAITKSIVECEVPEILSRLAVCTKIDTTREKRISNRLDRARKKITEYEKEIKNLQNQLQD